MHGPKRKALGALRCSGPPRARESAYRCLLRFCLTFGHARLFYEVDTAVPWRMVPRSSGCKDAFDQLLFPRVPLRYALPGALVGADALIGPLHQLPSTAKPAAAKREAETMRQPPRRGRHPPPRDGSINFVEEYSVPDGQAKSALAPIRRPPCARRATAPERAQAIFSLPPGAAHSLFVKNKKRMGGAPLWEQPPGGSQTPEAAVRRPLSCYPRWSVRPNR